MSIGTGFSDMTKRNSKMFPASEHLKAFNIWNKNNIF